MIRLYSKTKYIWAKSVFYYCLSLVIMLLIVKVNHVQAQMLSIFIMIFHLAINSIHTFSFTLIDNSIEIRNQLRPLFKKCYDFGCINDIEIKGVVNKGITLAIDFKYKSKKYFAVNKIKIEELQNIVDEFKKYKLENSHSRCP